MRCSSSVTHFGTTTVHPSMTVLTKDQGASISSLLLDAILNEITPTADVCKLLLQHLLPAAVTAHISLHKIYSLLRIIALKRASVFGVIDAEKELQCHRYGRQPASTIQGESFMFAD